MFYDSCQPLVIFNSDCKCVQITFAFKSGASHSKLFLCAGTSPCGEANTAVRAESDGGRRKEKLDRELVGGNRGTKFASVTLVSYLHG